MFLEKWNINLSDNQQEPGQYNLYWETYGGRMNSWKAQMFIAILLDNTSCTGHSDWPAVVDHTETALSTEGDQTLVSV